MSSRKAFRALELEQPRALRKHVARRYKANIDPFSTSMPTNKKQSDTNHEPVSEIIHEMRLALATITEQLSRLGKLPADVRSSIPIAPPAAGSLGDCLLPISRVGQRWDCQHQAAWERLAQAGANLVQFGNHRYVPLSTVVALEQKLTTPLGLFPSRKRDRLANRSRARRRLKTHKEPVTPND
jgi:hypothetical protein